MAILIRDYSDDLIIEQEEFKESWMSAKKRGIQSAFHLLFLTIIPFAALFALTFFVYSVYTLDIIYTFDQSLKFLQSDIVRVYFSLMLLGPAFIFFSSKRKHMVRGKTKSGESFCYEDPSKN